MKIFEDYAQFYDYFYKNKNYHKESFWLEKVFKKFSPFKVKTILDLGCGTGSHDFILAKKGYKITGVDLSRKMLAIARKKAEKSHVKIDFHHNDIRYIKLNKKFDAIISLFAVIGYQKNNKDLEKTFLVANRHLKKNGLFIFDCWFGPAVLANKPKNKMKKIRLKNGCLVRRTKCCFNLLKQVVDVHFMIKPYLKNNKLIKLIEETHPMRFFFYQELVYFLERAGFDVISISPFLKFSTAPTEKNWNISVVVRKK